MKDIKYLLLFAIVVIIIAWQADSVIATFDSPISPTSPVYLPVVIR